MFENAYRFIINVVIIFFLSLLKVNIKSTKQDR